MPSADFDQILQLNAVILLLILQLIKLSGFYAAYQIIQSKAWNLTLCTPTIPKNLSDMKVYVKNFCFLFFVVFLSDFM